LKPLNLHERIEKIESMDELPLSKIIIRGKFTMSDCHNWISNCIPEVPPNVGSDDEKQPHLFYFKSTFVGTYIRI